jgi:hypothetical protein
MVANTLWFFAKGVDYPPKLLSQGTGLTSRDICKRVAPLTKEEATFLQYL